MNDSLKSLIYNNIKVAFVVQRYGPEINGGAEFHCREVAEHLSKYCKVEVITTCAIDYITWKNEYPEGETTINEVTVRRFPVDFPRNIIKFNKHSEQLFSKKHTVSDEHEWMKLQGPYSSKLLHFIKNNKDKYDIFIFFTYLYCTTFFCLPLVADKAILVPTAHDEPPIYLSIFKEIFNIPRAIIYNTIEEKEFVNRQFHNEIIPSDIVGVGVTVPMNPGEANSKLVHLNEDFLIYIGRVDESKGCGELFDYFTRYKMETTSSVKLLVLGKAVMEIPKHPDIIYLGFVSDKEKYSSLKASKILLMPSKYESLSMVLLEAWYCKKPVLVSGQCDVLKGQCKRSNAGLWYNDYEEFKECINLLLVDGRLREQLGDNGREFVDTYYSWETIDKKYLDIFEKIHIG